MKRLIFSLLALLMLTSCSSKPVQQQFFAMDTVMSITAYGNHAEAAVSDAVATINKFETLFSRTRPDSDVYRLNTETTALLSSETAEMLTMALEWNKKTSGAFDVTIAPVSAAWGFSGAEGHRIPSGDELSSLLDLVDSSALSLDVHTAAFTKPDMELDLGGIAKGYTGGKVDAVLREHGVKSALLDLGHNITVIGAKPDGSAWRIAVQDPIDNNRTVGILSLADCSAVTSGGYQRWFELDGQRYHHIIDPRTGYPADSGLLSTTVVCSDPGLADLLSTATFVLGEKDALNLWRTEGGFDLILVTDDSRLIVTEGLKDRFAADSSLGYALEYVKK